MGKERLKIFSRPRDFINIKKLMNRGFYEVVWTFHKNKLDLRFAR